MRNIVTLVFIMFIGGYYLHLEDLGHKNRVNISYRNASQSGGKDIFAAMLVKYPVANETSHDSVLVASVSETDLRRNCASADDGLQRALFPADLNLSDSGIRIQYTAYQQSLPALNGGVPTTVSFQETFKHDKQLRTDSHHRNALSYKRILDARIRSSST